MKTTFHLPTKPYSVIDGVNRYALATGSPENAYRGASANYNGHDYGFERPNQFVKYWRVNYIWAGINRVARGTLAECLEAARRAYENGGLGSSSSVTVESEEDIATCRAAEGWVEGLDPMTWHTDLHKAVPEAFSMQSYLPEAVAHLIAARDLAEYEALCRESLDRRKALTAASK